MIYIVVALFHEAKTFINYYNLKQVNNTTKFRIYKNDDISLVITGTGPINAAIGTTYILTSSSVNSNDILLNVGICGSADKSFDIGQVMLCNKIIDNSSGKSFYPDIIFKHPFKEATVETFNNPIINNGKKSLLTAGQLVDMEASGIFEAASMFISLQNIYFIKIVSDYLNSDSITSSNINELIGKNINDIGIWLRTIEKEICYKNYHIGMQDKQMLESICERLKLSVTMRHQLFEFSKLYCIRTGKDLGFMNDYLNIECNSKNEGKKYFAEIKKRLNSF